MQRGCGKAGEGGTMCHVGRATAGIRFSDESTAGGSWLVGSVRVQCR